MPDKNAKRMIANNKKARHDYFLDEFYEAGIELVGTEVKSLRAGRCSIKESFIEIKDGEVSVKEADCPDKICVNHKKISNVGESIICLPHKLVIEIRE